MSTPTRPTSAPQWARVERPSAPPAEAQRPAPVRAAPAKAPATKKATAKATTKKATAKATTKKSTTKKATTKSASAQKSPAKGPLSRRPAAPKPGTLKPGTPQPVAQRPAAPQPATRAPQSPQRRAESALTETAKSSLSALQVALSRAKSTMVPPLEQRKDEREAERKRATRRRRAIVWGRRCGYVLLVAAAIWLVLLSPVFALDPAKVQVTGYGTVVDPIAVNTVVTAQEGQSLATLSTGHVASQLKDIPGVRVAHVEKHWPDGLVVTLESREPVAALPDRGGGFTLVDDEGVQVGKAAAVPAGLPSLAIPQDNEKILQAALGVYAALPAELRARVNAITAPTEDSVSFLLADGPRVDWGSAEDSALKAQVLQVLLGSEKAATADVIDVSAPTLPITKSD